MASQSIESFTPLPRGVEDFTAEWLTRALAVRYPGAVVTSCHIGTVISGTATKVRLLLDYNAAGHLPPTMWAKGGFIEHAHTYYESFAVEASFFRDWAPRLPINIPKAYFAALEGGVQGVVLMEDLLARNASFGNATKPLTLDQQAQTLTMLARLHAEWWESPRLHELESFSVKWAAADRVVMRMLESAYFESCLKNGRGSEIVGPYRDPSRVTEGLRAQWRKGEDIPQCFSHGDAHLGNMFFERDGAPGFLDWQSYQRGPYMHDVAYSLIGGLTIEDRRHAQRDLLDGYLKALAG